MKDVNISRNFSNHEEYPHSVAERGVEEDTLYSYISTTFLNGYINYVDVIFACVIDRYSDDWDKEVPEAVEKVHKLPHSNIKKMPDDVLILAESENDWWYFWVDKDCSDSCIGRRPKDGISKDEWIAMLKEFIRVNPNGTFKSNKFMEIKLKGWITLG